MPVDVEGQQHAACGYKLFVSRTAQSVTFEAASDHSCQGSDALHAQDNSRQLGM